MTLERDYLGKVLRTVGRRATFYAVDHERSQPGRVVFWSSRAMPIIASSKSGPEVYWDERFFQFTRHIFRSISEPDRRIQLPTSTSIASLHLEAVIWCALAERALNPSVLDAELAMGIVLQSSVFLHHSMRVLGPFDEAFEEEEGFTQARTAIFEMFVSEHELAHYAIKSGGRPSDDMLKNVGLAMRMIESKFAELTELGDTHPTIVELFSFAVAARASKPIMEEIWADTLALEEMTRIFAASDITKGFPTSLVVWLISQGALYGIAALRLLGLVDSLSETDPDGFKERWDQQRRQFTARETYLRTILSAIIVGSEEDEEETHDHQLRRLHELSGRLFKVVTEAENEWHQRWRDGRLNELREEGRGAIGRRKFDSSLAVNFAGERLGWFRGRRLSSPPAYPAATVSDEDAARISKLGHLVHMMRGTTPEGRPAFYFILVKPADEERFLAALADDGEMNLGNFGELIASNYGDRPSLEVLAYLKDRFGFDVPHRSEAIEDKPKGVRPGSAVDVLRQYSVRARRALVVFALSTVVQLGKRPGAHHFYVTFDTRVLGVTLPDWLRNQHPGEMTIHLQHAFWNLEVSDPGFTVDLTFGGREARLYVPFLAVTHFSDPSVSISLDFPLADADAVEGEQDYLEQAIGQAGLDLVAERIDYATIEQRAHRATLITLMGAFARGAGTRDGDSFRVELDAGAMTLGAPGAWRHEDGSISFVISGTPPPIRFVGEPAGWHITPEGSNEVFVPIRAVRRFVALSDGTEAELRFDHPRLDRVRPH